MGRAKAAALSNAVAVAGKNGKKNAASAPEAPGTRGGREGA